MNNLNYSKKNKTGSFISIKCLTESARVSLVALSVFSIFLIGLPLSAQNFEKGGSNYNEPTAPGVVPPDPGGCSLSPVTTFSNPTPVAISATGPAVVTSTITVSGAGTNLWDVDLITNLTHTFAADIDMTLTSPSGTVVTLTTDNGAGNDDVFNGTRWDDSANPGGQVPYTTNDGLTTDNLYANLTTATPLAPEESLSAFRGENPNGVWTLTISDDLAGDGGSLNGWSLDIATLGLTPSASLISTTNSTPVAIPTGPAVVTSTITPQTIGYRITKVTLTTNITHTFAADIDMTLTSPSGTVVTLTTDNGAGNDNVFNGTVWDDDANPGGQVPYTTNDGLTTDNLYANLTTATPLVPEESLGAFAGEDPNGVWTLTVSDDLAGDGGSIDSWTLNITVGSCVVTAANVSASGRVLRANGSGISGATVYAQSAGGETVSTRTNSFGFYSFDDLTIGETYILSVFAKQAQFAPKVITPNDNLSDLDFTPQ